MPRNECKGLQEARDILRNGRGNHVAASAVGSTDLNPAKNYILGAGLCLK